MKKSWKNYLITAGIALLMSLLVLVIRNTFSVTEQAQLFQDLSDAFIIPGVIVLCVAGLVFSTNGGTFDMLSFSVTKVFDLFRKEENKRGHKNFYEYRKAKEGTERSFWHLIIVGAVFIVIGVVFYIIYTQY